MSGRRSSNEVARTERAVVRLPLGHGLPARKVSVTCEPCHLRMMAGDVERSEEVWFNQRDVLIVKSDRQKPLIVLCMSPATGIAKGTA
jgi:hypothetical protein